MDKKLLINAFGWGFVLWLIGYILGFALFFVLPPDLLGWVIMPIGAIITVFVCLKKIDGRSVRDYVPMAVAWTAMAIVLDYIFIVVLLSSSSYYKLDVYLYYALTFIIPLVTGAWKQREMARANKPGK